MTTQKNNDSVKVWHRGLIASLEPRLMYDGAVGVVAVEVVDSAPDGDASEPAAETTEIATPTSEELVNVLLPDPDTTLEPQETSGTGQGTPHIDGLTTEVALLEDDDVSNGSTVISQALNAADALESDGTTSTLTLLDALSGDAGDRNEIAVIDTGISDYQLLVDTAEDAGMEVITLDATSDGLETLADILTGRKDIDALHILSHGDEGEVILGDDVLSNDTLNDHSEALEIITETLSDDADILLYGCRVGQNEGGLDFVENLSIQTGADIAASDDLTGGADKGGDWDLEIATGDIEADQPFNKKSLRDFSDILAPFTGTIDFGTYVSAGSPNGGTGSNNASFTAGDYTLIVDGESADTYAGAKLGPLYSYVMFGYNGSSEKPESKLTISFSGGETFDATSLWIYNWSGSADTFTISSDQPGDSYSVGSIANEADKTANFNFTGITKLYVTSADNSFMGNIDTLVIANVGASANSAPVITLPTAPTVSEDAVNVAIADNINIADSDGDNQTVTLTMTGGTGSVTAAGGVSFSTGDGTDDASMTFTGTVADINTTLDSLTFTPTANLNGTNAGSIQIQTDDGNSGTDDQTVTFDISSINDDPTNTGTFPTDITVSEDVAGNVDLSGMTLADVDTTGDVVMTLTATGGTMAASSGGSVTVGGSATGTLTLTGTIANIDTYLNTNTNIKYTGPSNANGADAETVAVKINDADGSGDVALGTFNLDITAVNDDPTNTGTFPTDITVTEDVEGDINLSGLTLGDVDSSGSVVMTLTATGGTMTASTGGSVTVGGSGTGTLTLTGTVTNIDTYLNTTTNIKYTGPSNVSGADAETIAVKINDADGSGDVALGTFNLDITGVNDAPTNTGTFPTDITVSEDVAGNVDLSGMTLGDVDTTGNVVMTLTATGGTMAATTAGSVTVGGSTTGTLTLTGTISNIDTFLNTPSKIQYTGPSNVSGANAETVAVKINDADGSGDVALGTFNLDITAVNDDPTNTGTFPTDITVTEDVEGDINLSGLTLGDVDSTGNVVMTLTATGGTMAASTGGSVTVGGSGTGTVTLTGTVANIDTYLNTTTNIKYTGASNVSGADAETIAVKINDADGSGDVALGTFNLDITAVNDAPTLTNNGTYSLGSVNEETASTGVLVSTILSDGAINGSDVDASADSGVAITAVTGTGSWEFSTDNSNWTSFGTVSGTGALLLNSTTYVRFTGSNEYAGTPDFTFKAWDQTTGTPSTNGSAQTGDPSTNGNSTAYSTGNAKATLTVNAVDDSPTLADGGASLAALEDVNTAMDLSNITVADADTTGDITLTISAGDTGAALTATGAGGTVNSVDVVQSNAYTLTLSGTTSELNSYLGSNGVNDITYTTSSNNTSNDSLSIVANDGNSNSSSTDITINVTGVNDEPTATATGDNNSAAGGGAAVSVFSGTTISAVDASENISSVTFTVSGLVDTSNEKMIIDGSTVDLMTTVGSTDATNIAYSVTFGSGTATVTLTGPAAGSAANTVFQTALNGMTYQNTEGSVTVGNRIFTLTEVTDVGGTSNGGDDTLATSISSTISVVNGDTPTATSATKSATEDTAFTMTTSEIIASQELNGIDAVEYITVSSISGGALALTGSPTASTATDGSALAIAGALTAGAKINIAHLTLIEFTPTANSTVSGSMVYTVTDAGGDASASATLTINLAAQNDAPTGVGEPTDITVSEDIASNLDLSSITIDDVDSSSLTVVLTAGSGTMTASDSGGVVVSNSGTGAITLVGSPASIDTFLNDGANIQYTGTTNTNGNNATTLTVTADDGDGSGLVTLATINIDITAVNDNPTGTGEPTNLTVTEETASELDLSTMTIGDVDSAGITVLLSVSSGTMSAADGAAVGAGVTESGNGTGIITLVGSPADIDSYLNTGSNIQYTGASNVAGLAAATLTITANDGDGSGNVTLGTVNIDITNISDTPTGADKSITLKTDSTHTFTATDFGFSDPDTGDALNRIQINSQTLTGGSLTLSNVAVTDGQWINVADIVNLIYTPFSAGTDSFTFTVEDNSSSNATDATPRTLTFNVTAVTPPAEPVPVEPPPVEEVPVATLPEPPPPPEPPPEPPPPTQEPGAIDNLGTIVETNLFGDTEAAPGGETGPENGFDSPPAGSETNSPQPPPPAPPADGQDAGQTGTTSRETIQVDSQGNVQFSGDNGSEQAGLFRVESLQVDTETGNLELVIQGTSGINMADFFVTMADGSPLPEWLTVDSATGKITGKLPAGIDGFSLRILSTNEQGETITLEVELKFEDTLDADNGEATVHPDTGGKGSEMTVGLLPLSQQLTEVHPVPVGYGDQLLESLA